MLHMARLHDNRTRITWLENHTITYWYTWTRDNITDTHATNCCRLDTNFWFDLVNKKKLLRRLYIFPLPEYFWQQNSAPSSSLDSRASFCFASRGKFQVTSPAKRASLHLSSLVLLTVESIYLLSYQRGLCLDVAFVLSLKPYWAKKNHNRSPNMESKSLIRGSCAVTQAQSLAESQQRIALMLSPTRDCFCRRILDYKVSTHTTISPRRRRKTDINKHFSFQQVIVELAKSPERLNENLKRSNRSGGRKRNLDRLSSKKASKMSPGASFLAKNIPVHFVSWHMESGIHYNVKIDCLSRCIRTSCWLLALLQWTVVLDFTLRGPTQAEHLTKKRVANCNRILARIHVKTMSEPVCGKSSRTITIGCLFGRQEEEGSRDGEARSESERVNIKSVGTLKQGAALVVPYLGRRIAFLALHHRRFR